MRSNRGIILFIILVLPLFIYLFLKGCEHNYNWLNEATFVEGSDTTVHVAWEKVPEPSLVNQNNQAFTWDSVKGHTVIISMIPEDERLRSRVLKAMEGFSQRYLDDPLLKMISIPGTEGLNLVEQMRIYANKHNARDEDWYLLSGPEDELNRIAENAFLMNRDSADLRFMLMDRKGRIRYGDEGYSIGINQNGSQKLIDEIKLLRLEYEHRKE